MNAQTQPEGSDLKFGPREIDVILKNALSGDPSELRRFMILLNSKQGELRQSRAFELFERIFRSGREHKEQIEILTITGPLFREQDFNLLLTDERYRLHPLVRAALVSSLATTQPTLLPQFTNPFETLEDLVKGGEYNVYVATLFDLLFTADQPALKRLIADLQSQPSGVMLKDSKVLFTPQQVIIVFGRLVNYRAPSGFSQERQVLLAKRLLILFLLLENYGDHIPFNLALRACQEIDNGYLIALTANLPNVDHDMFCRLCDVAEKMMGNSKRTLLAHRLFARGLDRQARKNMILGTKFQIPTKDLPEALRALKAAATAKI